MKGGIATETYKIVLSIILGIISVSLLTYSFFTSREKGPILSNTYLWATKEERKKMDKTAEYHLVTVVFGLLGIIFMLLTIRVFSSCIFLTIAIAILILTLLVYAIKESIKTIKNE